MTFRLDRRGAARFEDSAAAERISIFMVGLAMLMFVVLVALSVGSYLSPAIVVPYSRWILIIVPSGLVFFWAVYVSRGDISADALSKRTRIVLGGLAVACVIYGVVTFDRDLNSHPTGQPEHNQALHRYEVINHGSVTVVSKHVYESLLAITNRSFLGWTAMFLAIATPLIVNHVARVRQEPIQT